MKAEKLAEAVARQRGWVDRGRDSEGCTHWGRPGPSPMQRGESCFHPLDFYTEDPRGIMELVRALTDEAPHFSVTFYKGGSVRLPGRPGRPSFNTVLEAYAAVFGIEEDSRG